MSVFQLPAGPLAAGAMAAAASLAQGRSQEELARMAAFFTLLGDALAAFALDTGTTGP